MHDVGVVLAGEDIPRAPHVCGELINLGKVTIHDSIANPLISKISDHEIVGRCFTEFRIFQIDTSDPGALRFETSDEMAADKSAGTAD